MHNVNLSQKGGTYAVTVGHCQNQLGVWGAVFPPAGPAQSPGGGPGEAPEILHFLLPENYLKTHVLRAKSELL